MPKTKGRSLALLSAIMQFPVFGRDRSILEQVQNLERLADEYTKSAGHDVAPDILLSTLVRVLPKEIQRHIQLTMGEDATYAQVREQVLMSLFWKKMKALFLQTKICEVSQIRINKNPLGLVVNKHLLKVETSNQTW